MGQVLDQGHKYIEDIGIVLCKEKKRTIVEYALRDARKRISVAAYEITKTIPKKLKDQAPSPGAVAQCWTQKAGLMCGLKLCMIGVD
ncbi:PDDEXK nuclease domain-containing protein [Caballeronia sp. LZ043]|uniref:PDDEXK nuclease domain-containing protein n=1 Tax=Caballeronia sp. LZ043 TaxID=3038569 RepID=UPI00285C5D02|nr:PDDEXK nuclease domain-containing protein [Caballeronia sp. LZ043]MDR5819999.1 PDDEXK nuclease domain-containing protein [Caballeronia sp. LZ043]